MKRIRSVFIAATTTLVFCMSLSTAMAKDEVKRIGGAIKALKEISAIQKKGIPPGMFSNANAIAIIPGATKNDFMVSGRNPGGVLLVHEKDGSWSSPLFIRLSGGTLGWQIVGEPMDIILVFKNKERVDAVMKGKLYMDVKVNVVPGPLGKTMKAATKEELKAGINSYVYSHGEIVDVTVADATVQIDSAGNDEFYGKAKIVAGDIVSGKVEKTSDDVKNLQKLLADYAAKK
jgi:lipid-binding SYLF domain-containing protein